MLQVICLVPICDLYGNLGRLVRIKFLPLRGTTRSVRAVASNCNTLYGWFEPTPMGACPTASESIYFTYGLTSC